jgi:chromosome segregation protein
MERSNAGGRLKSLELQGYKTFAGRVTFEFSPTITAIVGPNGSGKSNIADAIRWVLGEQSYSLLRGKKTEDMIYHGSEARARASMALASISFDNSEGWLPIDFGEVSIARRAFRDGQNEYLLNNQRVRLRQVYELLAECGLGQRTYTIIGQGLVDAVLSLRAEDRRRLFEEAAGIGLYRARREEALRRLETTERNLERVQDILAELKPRLRSLEKQARRAEEYEHIRQDLRLSLRQWYGYHWSSAQHILAASREEAESQRRNRDEVRQRQEEVNRLLLSSRMERDRLRAELHRISEQQSGLFARREELGRAVAVAGERLKWMEDQERTLRLEIQAAEEERGEAESRLRYQQVELEQRQRAIADVDSELGRLRDPSAWEGEQGLAAHARAERLRSEREQAVAEAAGLHARLEQAEQQLGQARTRRETAVQGADQASARLSQMTQARVQAEALRDQAQEALEALRQQEQTAQQGLDAARKGLAEAQRSAESARREQAARQAQLEFLVKGASLAPHGSERLKQAGRAGELPGWMGELWEHCRPEPRFERAVRGALGDLVHASILASVEDVEAAARWLSSAEHTGRSALIPAAPKTAASADWLSDRAILARAADVVTADPGYEGAVAGLLRNTGIVQDIPSARHLIESLPPEGRLVTIDGTLLLPGGVVLVEGDAQTPAVEDVQRVVDKLEEKAGRLTQDVELAEGDVSQRERELADLQSRRDSQAEALAGMEREREQSRLTEQAAKSECDALEQTRAAAEEDVMRLGGEVETLRLAQAEGLLRQEELRQALEEVEVAADPQKAAALQSELRARGEALALALEETQARQTDANARLASIDRLIAGYGERLEGDLRGMQGTRREEVQLSTELQEVEAKLAGLSEQAAPLEQLLATAESGRGPLEEQEAALRMEIQAAERRHAQAQVELARHEQELNGLRQRIEDDFGLVAFNYENGTTGPVPLPLEGLVEELPQVDELPMELEGQVTRLRLQIRRMGAVNTEAQREYQEVKERVEFMVTQVDDLRGAETRIREVITELDALMEREFRKTFDAVAVHFRQAFTRLFGGGSARLSLTDPKDLTNTGIDIEARLPGRREQGLAMLSGGERSLTACALVFALLQVSPTPFCVLDEVDAMLDESNVVRFCEMLQELSANTQFILITHNRQTIQAAEIVYGITMGSDSASKVMGIRLGDHEPALVS